MAVLQQSDGPFIIARRVGVLEGLADELREVLGRRGGALFLRRRRGRRVAASRSSERAVPAPASANAV